MINSEVLQQVKKFRMHIAKKALDIAAGGFKTAFRGVGLEYEETRLYQEGDDARNIDWNVTARLQVPFVKTYKEERQLPMMLLLDLSASMLFGTVGKTKKEALVEIAAMLLLGGVKCGGSVGMALFTDGLEGYFPPKHSASYVEALIHKLIVFTPKSLKTDLGASLRVFERIFRKRGVCIVISDFLETFPKRELALAAKRHDLVGICLLDTCEKVLPSVNLLSLRDMETGKHLVVDTGCAKVRRKLQERLRKREQSYAKHFQQQGARWLALSTCGPYLKVLGDFFARKGANV